MIILRKNNHYKNAHSYQEAQALVDDGYDIIKNKTGFNQMAEQQIKEKPKPKKKQKSKK
jgi:hypothetical protein